MEFSSYLIPTAHRKIRIRSYGERNLFVTLDFAKESYSPGDPVISKLKVRKVDGTLLPKDTVFSYTANVRLTLIIHTSLNSNQFKNLN